MDQYECSPGRLRVHRTGEFASRACRSHDAKRAAARES
jgi:hypothetical protein